MERAPIGESWELRFNSMAYRWAKVPFRSELWTAYTSQGGTEGAVTALEAHGNSPHRRIMGTEIQLYGIPLGEGTIPRTGNVAISIVWIRADDSESWPYLVSAFE